MESSQQELPRRSKRPLSSWSVLFLAQYQLNRDQLVHSKTKRLDDLVKGMFCLLTNQSTILNKFTNILLGHNAKRNLDAKHEARSTFQSTTWVVA